MLSMPQKKEESQKDPSVDQISVGLQNRIFGCTYFNQGLDFSSHAEAPYIGMFCIRLKLSLTCVQVTAST